MSFTYGKNNGLSFVNNLNSFKSDNSSSGGYDAGTILVRPGVETAARDFYDNFDRSIFSIQTSEGVLDNPYRLTDQEITYLALYLNGSNPVNSTNRANLKAAYDKYQQALKWYSDQQSLIENREYNSYESDVERQQEAGLNPDLNGVSSAPSEPATSGTSPVTSPELSSPLDVAFNVIGGVAQLATAVSSTLGAVSQMGVNAANIKNARLLYSQNLLGEVLPSLVQYLPDEAFNKGAKLSDYLTEDFVVGSGFSKQDYGIISEFISGANLPQSSRAEFQENLTRALDARQKRIRLASDPLAPGFENDFFQTYLRHDANYRYYQSISRSLQEQFNARKSELINPELAAEAFDSQNQQTVNSETLQEYTLKSTLAKMLPDIYLLQQAYDNLQSSDPVSKAVGLSLYNVVTGKNGSTVSGIYTGVAAGGSFTSDTGLTGDDGLFDTFIHWMFGNPETGQKNLVDRVWGYLKGTGTDFLGWLKSLGSDFIDQYNPERQSGSTSINTPLDSYNNLK